MPLYEYQCQTCKRTLEKRQKFSDPELTECPTCGGRLEKLISAPAVQFKGGGWFADGYGNKSAAKSGSSDSSASAGSSSGSPDGASSSSGAASTTTAAPAAPASTPSTTK